MCLHKPSNMQIEWQTYNNVTCCCGCNANHIIKWLQPHQQFEWQCEIMNMTWATATNKYACTGNNICEAYRFVCISLCRAIKQTQITLQIPYKSCMQQAVQYQEPWCVCICMFQIGCTWKCLNLSMARPPLEKCDGCSYKYGTHVKQIWHTYKLGYAKLS